VPDLPVLPIIPKGLLRASKSLSVLLLYRVAVGNVAPRLNLLLVNRNDSAESKDGLIEVFGAHVGTAACEPIVSSEPIDGESLVEAFDRLYVLTSVEVPASKRAHSSSTLLTTFPPGAPVVLVVLAHISEQAQNVCLTDTFPVFS